MEGNLRFKIDWGSLQWEGNLPFLLCLTLYSRANSKYKPPGGLYSEGRLNGGFFTLRFWGAYIWRDLYMEGLIFRMLRYPVKGLNLSVVDKTMTPSPWITIWITHTDYPKMDYAA